MANEPESDHRGFPWVDGLPAPLADAMQEKGRRVTLAAGQLLHGKGDPADGLYLLTKGRVRIANVTEEGKELVLTDLGPGDLFGEISLFDGLPRTHDAIAIEEARVSCLSPDDLRALLELNPALYPFFLRMLSLKLRLCFNVMNDAALLPVPARLARRVLWLAGAFETPAGGAPTALRPVDLSQSELAQMVGSSRQTVNRELKAWERSGIVERRDDAIFVRDVTALGKLSEGRGADDTADASR